MSQNIVVPERDITDQRSTYNNYIWRVFLFGSIGNRQNTRSSNTVSHSFTINGRISLVVSWYRLLKSPIFMSRILSGFAEFLDPNPNII